MRTEASSALELFAPCASARQNQVKFICLAFTVSGNTQTIMNSVFGTRMSDPRSPCVSVDGLYCCTPTHTSGQQERGCTRPDSLRRHSNSLPEQHAAYSHHATAQRIHRELRSVHNKSCQVARPPQSVLGGHLQGSSNTHQIRHKSYISVPASKWHITHCSRC